MVERTPRTMLTLFADDPFDSGALIALGERESRHAHVRRVALGEPVRLVNGRGGVAHGRAVKVSRSQLVVEVHEVANHPPLPEVHLLVPVADRDRMLWLAEKAVELGIASWRPVQWRRSRDVTPRGEGRSFQQRVRARMVGALTQSGGAWLPVHHPNAPLDRAIAALPPEGARFLLDASGTPMLGAVRGAPLTLAVGPEGGLEPGEYEALCAVGFVPVTLGPSTLRFETAAVAALSVAWAVVTAPVEVVRD